MARLGPRGPDQAHSRSDKDGTGLHDRSVNTRVVAVELNDGLEHSFVRFRRVWIEVHDRAADIARRHADRRSGLGVPEYQSPTDPGIFLKWSGLAGLEHDVGAEAPAIDARASLGADASDSRLAQHRYRRIVENPVLDPHEFHAGTQATRDLVGEFGIA